MAIILVADPDAPLRRLLTRWLAPRGHTALEAAGAADATDLLRQRAVDLMIAAARLSGASTLDVVRDWHAACGTRPAVLVGAACERRAAQSWIESGWLRWFEPPVAPAQLLQAVERLLTARGETPWP